MINEVDGDLTCFSDAELMARTRAGDLNAYGVLYSRYLSVARACARSYADDAQTAHDLISEAFARILSATRRGKGPSEAFASYLRMTIRNVAYEWAAQDKRTVSVAEYDERDAGYAELDWGEWSDNELIKTAFRGLPERWRMILWRTAVEGESPAALADDLGLTPNAVAALAMRAREGLRLAYLQAHIAKENRRSCREHALRLAAHLRKPLGRRQRITLRKHLLACSSCRRLESELAEVNRWLGATTAPVAIAGASGGVASLLPWAGGSAHSGWVTGVVAGAAALTITTGVTGDAPTVGPPSGPVVVRSFHDVEVQRTPQQYPDTRPIGDARSPHRPAVERTTPFPPGLVKKDRRPPGLAKKGGVPPGLAKKGGVPPGRAKKGGVPPGQVKKGGVPPGQVKKGGVPPGQAKKNGVPPGQAKRNTPPRRSSTAMPPGLAKKNDSVRHPHRTAPRLRARPGPSGEAGKGRPHGSGLGKGGRSRGSGPGKGGRPHGSGTGKSGN